ncbi:DUF6301 family protein [Couchioplanes caeruleus]|uniref:Uncharacterized protein n=2 Tax=Couchioplanes caeruleus TaxID=56438 RepID=A0A1K0FQ59_9ACTN|nr:DUF6301 family protein [Couchioplanes caeruleus]OJF14975.1 hypothetical protein BG844_06985 [Couchioplanes caeruleus subsp. caeruleus]ROP30461.1 hypothetical protein EDD30_3313 [Couchioplanes caeruleus]
MTAWRTIDDDALRSLAAGIGDTRWSWRPDGVPELCRRLGWDLLEVIDGKGAVSEAGWNLGGEEIELAFRGGHVDDITMQITQLVRQAGPDRDRFMGDAFADAVATVAAALGEPTGRQQSEPPTVRWRLEDSTVLIRNLEVDVTLTWASNRFQDEWDQVAEAMA